jgi:predicted component of type VI protein secretion system
MKSYEQIQDYKRAYYLVNKRKLCEYSKNYYLYSKCYRDMTNEEISDSLKDFIKKYKSNYKKNDNSKINIKKQNIIISFK